MSDRNDPAGEEQPPPPPPPPNQVNVRTLLGSEFPKPPEEKSGGRQRDEQ